MGYFAERCLEVDCIKIRTERELVEVGVTASDYYSQQSTKQVVSEQASGVSSLKKS